MDNYEYIFKTNREKKLESLFELSNDLKSIFDQKINYDLALQVGDRTIECHRAILSACSSWFATQIEHPYGTDPFSLTVNENEQVLDALLVYIYTRNLNLVQSLGIPLIDLWIAAKNYGVSRLRALLIEMIKKENYVGPKKGCTFLWQVHANDCIYEYQSYYLNFSVDGTDGWCIHLAQMDFPELEDNYWFCLRVERLIRAKNENLFHIMNLKIHFQYSEVIAEETELDYIFKIGEDPEMLLYFSLKKLHSSQNTLLPFGLITIKADMTVLAVVPASSQRVLFQLKGEHPKELEDEMLGLWKDMWELKKEAKYTDFELYNRGGNFYFEAKLHSYILVARSLIPIEDFGKLFRYGGSKFNVMSSFLTYLYTGLPKYLQGHMREVYLFACKLQLSETKKKYSKLLADNLTVSNFSLFYEDSYMYNDTDLSDALLRFAVTNNLVGATSMVPELVSPM